MADDAAVALLAADATHDIEDKWKDYLKASKIMNGMDDATTMSALMSGGSKTYTSARFFGCGFSTEPAKVNASFEALPVASSSTLVFGLDGSGPADQKIDFVKMLSSFDVTTAALKEPLATIVDTILSQVIHVQVDASATHKAGSWISTVSESTLQIVTALNFQLGGDDGLDLTKSIGPKIRDVLGVDIGDLKLSAAQLPRIRLKNWTFITGGSGRQPTYAGSLFELTVSIPVGQFYINLQTSSHKKLGASITVATGSVTIPDVISFIAGNDSKPDPDDANPQEPGLLDRIEFWKLSVNLPQPVEDTQSDEDPQAENGSTPSGGTARPTFNIGFFVNLTFSSDPSQAPLQVALNYDTGTRTFSGGLLTQTDYLGRLSPNFQDLDDLPPRKLATLPPSLDLKRYDEFKSLPNTVPTQLTQAFLSFKKATKKPTGEIASASVFQFAATMQSANKLEPPASDQVPFPFEWSEVMFQFSRTGSTVQGAAASTTMNFYSEFVLNSRDDKFESGNMAVELAYQKDASGSSWLFDAAAEDIQMGALASWFDPDMDDEVLAMVGKLKIETLDVTYTFAKDDQKASSFLFDAMISFGELQLRLYYQYTSSKAITSAAQLKANGDKAANLKPIKNPGSSDASQTSWRFDAYLDTSNPGATIGSIADSIMDDASSQLPSFVSDIEVHPATPDAKMISLHASKTTTTKGTTTKQRANFVLNISFSTIEFLFAQSVSRDMTSASGAPSGGTAPPRVVATKRLLRLSVGKLPFISDLPVVKELPQPYEHLQYMYATKEGLTRDEVASLNDMLTGDAGSDQIMFKPATRDAVNPAAATDPLVLLEGHHFVVIQDGKAVLDHVFKTGSANKNSTTTPLNRRAVMRATTNDPAAGGSGAGAGGGADLDSPSPPTKGAMTKKTPLLSITSIALQFKEGRIWIFLDATLQLGPISFTLLGFGVGIQLTGLKLNDLSTITTLIGGIDFQLKGLEVAFDKPPILIAGCFYHDIITRNGQTEDAYRGGIALTIPPYTFVAVGEYAEVTTSSGTYKSVFIYAKLDGPIIDFEFAILRGLRIGFGYNSMVRSPAVEELFDFPLINDHSAGGAGNHPMAILENMRGGDNPWIQLKQDSYWLAFGFTISSFDIIDATAVAVVAFRDGGPIFSIFGDLTIALPPKVPIPEAHLFYVEVLLMAELNFVEDCFKVMAALAPTSFVYVPFARLRGAFALYIWFGRNPHAGDWVFSVGGYHRSFQRPAHYPNPTRLGLDFNIDIIKITGEGYFAITPKAVMAGALLHCELDLRIVFAWLDAGFDVLIQFEPLHYWVTMHIEVGVECDIPLLFFTLHIRISLGARLELEGPEFGGTAYVDFWFFSFSFDFGARNSAPPALTLPEFYAVCEKSGPPDTSAQAVPQDGLTVQLKISLEDGCFTMPPDDTIAATAGKPNDSGPGSKWFVKGGSFKFRVSSVFALTAAYIETEDSAKRDAHGNTVPMQEQIKTPATLTTVGPEPTIKRLSSNPMHLLANDNDGIESKLCIAIEDVDDAGLAIEHFKPSFVMKPMPQAVWAANLSKQDQLSSAKGTIDLPMAVTLEAPDPILAIAKVPQFNATDMAKMCAGANIIPNLPAPVQSELLPQDHPIWFNGLTAQFQWDTVQRGWSSSSKTNLALANDITALCTSVLGWDKPPPEIAMKADEQGVTPWLVPVAHPVMLVDGTKRNAQGIKDGLANFYMELPQSSMTVLV